MRLVPVLILAVVSLIACSDDPQPSADPAPDMTAALPDSECAVGDFDAGRTVVVRHNDLVGGFGALGTRTPSELQAGLIRISVEADDENAGLASVSVIRGGSVVAVINGVEPGTTCAVDVELTAGSYEVTDVLQSASFDVIP